MNQLTTSYVTVSIGSNINREFHIRQAVAALKNHFGELACSPVYETAAVGFNGEDFLNLVVGFHTSIEVYAVSSVLKAIEDELGRDRSLPKFSARSIDLDLLGYDDLILDELGVQIPRHEILKNAFVLKPLSDIDGAGVHPQLGKSYQQLWAEMKESAGRIDVYQMDLN